MNRHRTPSARHATRGTRHRRLATDRARRGDLAIIVTEHHDYIMTSGGYGDGRRYRFAVVTSITRDGQVKRVQLAGYNQPEPLERVSGFQRLRLVSQHAVNVDAALATAAAHAWPSGAGGRPYATLAEAKAVVEE